MVENQPPKPRAAGATGGGPGLGFHYLQGMLSSLLWQPCRQRRKQAPLSEAPMECLGRGPQCQGRAGRAAGTAEVLTPTSPSPAVRSNSPAGPATGRQGPPWSPQNTSAQHGAWHTFLNERHLIMTSPNADSIQMPFLIAPGLIAFCFSDF